MPAVTRVFLLLVLDPAAQLFDIRVHTKELVTRAGLRVIHLQSTAAGVLTTLTGAACHTDTFRSDNQWVRARQFNVKV